MDTQLLSLLREIFKHISSIFWVAVVLLIPASLNAATITPSVMEISAQRGETIDERITIINNKTASQTYYIDVVPFESNDSGDAPVFIETDGTEGLYQWIELPSESFVVPARSGMSMPFKIHVPEYAEVGGQYAALTFSTAPAEVIATNGAVIDAKTAALILLEVEGPNSIRSAGLLDASFESGSSFNQGTYTFRIQNQGNVHLAPSGEISFQDFFGRTLRTIEVNSEGSRVLPGKTRTYTGSWGEEASLFQRLSNQFRTAAVGPISTTLSINYGVEGEVLKYKDTIWYIPWESGLVIIIVLMSNIFLYNLARKHR